MLINAIKEVGQQIYKDHSAQETSSKLYMAFERLHIHTTRHVTVNHNNYYTFK